jgi:hypothetical protein
VTVRAAGSHPLLDRLLTFDFGGWRAPVRRPRQAAVQVLTPPTSVAALRAGFTPTLHPSAVAAG